jgi:hypothetical protein
MDVLIVRKEPAFHAGFFLLHDAAERLSNAKVLLVLRAQPISVLLLSNAKVLLVLRTQPISVYF